MKQTGEWGHFLDSCHSPFGYNETIANEQYPLKKEEALRLGCTWIDVLPGTFGRETMTLEKIPDGIGDVSDDITKSILACASCKKNYTVILQELRFYRARSIPIPRECPNCRHEHRMKQRGPNTMWTRQCMCDHAGHGHAGRCATEFETTYAPDRQEIIYCEQCYQKEVI
jgi:hypothetical protein